MDYTEILHVEVVLEGYDTFMTYIKTNELVAAGVLLYITHELKTAMVEEIHSRIPGQSLVQSKCWMLAYK